MRGRFFSENKKSSQEIYACDDPVGVSLKDLRFSTLLIKSKPNEVVVI